MARKGFGLYIHWPYCARICPYCDFNVYKARGANEALIDALVADIKFTGAQIGDRALTSIHFGGGTPSLLPAEDMARLIEIACGVWTPDTDLEIGLEANPNDIDSETLNAWRDAGIERLSVGVQSFDNAALKFLGRDHGGGQAQQALEDALKMIPRVSCDLIFGLRGQTLDAWRADISTALQSGVAHISAYQLTVKPNTAFSRAVMRGDTKSVNDDQSADFYTSARDTLLAQGYSHYEVSNYAKCESDRSRHNELYWHGADYAGVGPGAHGRLIVNGQRIATVCAQRPDEYCRLIAKTGRGVKERETLSPHDIADEYVLMGLRCKDGLSLTRYQDISGQVLNPMALETHIRLGHLLQKQDRILPTEAGFMVLDAVSFALLC